METETWHGEKTTNNGRHGTEFVLTGTAGVITLLALISLIAAVTAMRLTEVSR